MPIYEYRCDDCNFQSEYLQKVSEPPLTQCPSCGRESFKKLLSAAGFQLKGSGWYVTDFRNSGTKPSNSNGGEAAAKDGNATAKDGDSGSKSGDGAAGGGETAAKPGSETSKAAGQAASAASA